MIDALIAFAVCAAGTYAIAWMFPLSSDPQTFFARRLMRMAARSVWVFVLIALGIGVAGRDPLAVTMGVILGWLVIGWTDAKRKPGDRA